MTARAMSLRALRTPTGMPISIDIATETSMMAMVCIACSHRPRQPMSQVSATSTSESTTRRLARKR